MILTDNPEVAIPLGSKELIARLVAAFPPRCIQPGETEISAHRYAAQVELVSELAEMLSEQEENASSVRE